MARLLIRHRIMDATMSEVSYSIKGFNGYGALADNNPNVVAPLGELSAFSRTFSTDRYLFSTGSGSTPASTVDVTVFSSIKADGTKQPVARPVSGLLTDIAAWSYRQALLGTFTMNPESYRIAVLAEFAAKIKDVTVGAMIDNGNLKLPGAVAFYIVPDGLTGVWGVGEKAALGDDPRGKVWFSDDRFRREYDESTHLFVAPLENLDDFFLPPATVREKVQARTLSQTMQIIRDVEDKRPTTYVRADEFNYVDPGDPTFTFPTSWSYLIWGAAGDNIDLIKERLIEWILENSTHTREEWAEILPDLFTATELIVLPLWNQYSVENSPIKAGVFSPIVNFNSAKVIASSGFTGTGYNQQHIDDNTSATGIPFKSVAMLTCGGPENRNGKKRFEQLWPDYMNVPSNNNNSDFGRMSLLTQGLCLMLEEMLKVAETMTEYSDIPSTMTRLKRTNSAGQTYLYLVKSYEKVQYLVASAASIQQFFPPSGWKDLDLTNEGAEGMVAMPHGTGGQPYETYFEATGGTGIYTYELVDAAYGPITNHSIDPVTGIYTATLDTVGGDANVVVRVKDTSNAYKQKTFTLHVITP